MVQAREASHFSAGSYTTAGAVVLDEEDLDLLQRSSGLVTIAQRETPPFIAGRSIAMSEWHGGKHED